MKHQPRKARQLLFVIGLVIILLTLACSLTGNGAETEDPGQMPTDTPTPTPIAGGEVPPTKASENQCDGLGGTLELQVLVGPAEAVGLEPVAMGDIPFSVSSEGGVYLIEGGNSISYEDVLASDWGTYTVNFSMEVELNGECTGEAGSEALNFSVVASGEQMVEVVVDGATYNYPWEGTHNFDLSFPLEDGATQEGEGWSFVLHLGE